MLKLLFLAFTALTLGAQSELQAFYIERTEVYSDYGSIYILRLANQLVPPDRESKQRDIDCLIREAKEAGIFSDVSAQLVQGKKRNMLTLVVNATPDPQLRTTLISEIALVGFSEVDNARFQEALDRNGVSAGSLLLKYSLNDLMERITKGLREISQDTDMEIPWISIRPAGRGKVRLIVSPAYPVDER
jgi:hypothetical protein